ncbi:Ribosomal protein L12 [Prunus dulcis]|uniref:Ribosomal protein L12 n=1 Tax=Prunus dulcis TaxID=3755 RepID=A0A4Y1RXF1_PRUDU|nr:Ribosomal protein L12 [Prunus dulcis]
MPKEVKVGALHKVPMWDFVQAVVVATRVLEIRCLAPRKCVFLRHGRRRGCLGASRFDAGSARPQKCVFLRHGRRRGCLGASRFVAGTARFIMGASLALHQWRALYNASPAMLACNRLTCQNCNSTRTRYVTTYGYSQVVNLRLSKTFVMPEIHKMSNITTKVACRSLSRFATFTLSRALSTATSANETRTQKLERIADELLDLTKIERHDYSILFRLKMGLNRYGPAVPGIGSASSESGPASADSKVVEKTAFDIKIEKFDAAAKIKIIKEVRTFTDLGLKEPKELVEKAPVVVKKGVTKEEAGPIVDKLKELSATVRNGGDGDRCREDGQGTAAIR